MAFNKGGTVDLNGIMVLMVNAVPSSTFATSDGPKTGGTECGHMIAAGGKQNGKRSMSAAAPTTIMRAGPPLGDRPPALSP